MPVYLKHSRYINPIIPILMGNNHANVTSWDFRMLVQRYMSILEQLMYQFEQK